MLASSLQALSALVWLSGTSAAHAQSGLEDVVISASRLEQRSFDASASIQAVDADTIERAGPQVNLSESAARIPGVSVLDRQNYAQDLQLSIRGFGARSAFGIRGVRLLVDGIPATMPDGQGQASTIFLPTTGRIEVLRGPAAQLYGNAAGGVLQAFTAEAPEQPQARLHYGAASFDTDLLRASAAGHWREAGIVAGWMRFRTDGFREHSAAERRHFNARVRIDAGPETRISLVGNAFDQPFALDPRGLTREQLEADPSQAGANAIAQDARKRVSQSQAGLVLEHAPEAGRRFTARVYLGERDLFQKLATPLQFQLAPTAQGGAIDLDRNYGGFGLQYSHELRLPDGRITAVLGIDYDRMNERRRGYVNDGGQIGALRRDESNSVDNADVYGHLDWLLAPRWTLSAGLRSSRVHFRSDDAFIAPGNGDDSGARTYRAINPVIGITHHASDTVNVYANLGRGFETPTFAELAYRSTDGSRTGLNLGLEAATSRHFEAGIKLRPSPAHRIDAAVFLIDTEDEIVVASSAGGRTTYRNAGRTRRSGFELAYSGRLSETLDAHLAISTLDARFRDAFQAGSGASARTIAAGNRLPGAPAAMLFGELVWSPRLAGAFYGLVAALEVVHVGRVFVDDLNSDAAEAYTIANLRAGLSREISAWRIEPFVRLNNVTDRRHVGSVIVNDGNERFFEPAPGFNWVAGLSVELAL